MSLMIWQWEAEWHFIHLFIYGYTFWLENVKNERKYYN